MKILCRANAGQQMHTERLRQGHRPRVRIDSQGLADQLDFGGRIGRCRPEPLLNALNLLRHGREDSLFESVRLVETPPSADLTQSDKDPSHRLEVEGFVAAEDQNEAAESYTESLDGLRFA